MKIKRYGKNQRALKKLLADEGTRVFQDGKDFKTVFQALIGYDYNFKKIEGGLELTDLIGDTWIIKTSQEIEIV